MQLLRLDLILFNILLAYSPPWQDNLIAFTLRSYTLIADLTITPCYTINYNHLSKTSKPYTPIARGMTINEWSARRAWPFWSYHRITSYWPARHLPLSWSGFWLVNTRLPWTRCTPPLHLVLLVATPDLICLNRNICKEPPAPLHVIPKYPRSDMEKS